MWRFIQVVFGTLVDSRVYSPTLILSECNHPLKTRIRRAAIVRLQPHDDFVARDQPSEKQQISQPATVGATLLSARRAIAPDKYYWENN